MAGQWIGDGSPEIQISSDGTEVETVMAEGSSGGNVFNAYWKEEGEEGATSGTHYWKIHITNLESNSVFVGLTDLEKFKEGWGMKGLLYGGPGNLSSGGALVLSGYGPHIKSDNTVGILAVFDSGHLKVYFDLNGKPLGLAFDLEESVLQGIFPCVHFSGTGKATIVKSNEIPTDLIRKEPVYEGIEGDWKCVEFKGQNPTTGITVGIFKNEDSSEGFRVHLHVLNHSSSVLFRDEEGKWHGSLGASTKMGGPPALMQLEHQMQELFENPSNVDVEEGFLVVSSTADVTSKWKRYSTAKSAVTENPFH